MYRFLTLTLLLILHASWAESLRVFTWEDYMDPDLVAEYEQKTGHTIEFIYFENDEQRDQILAETDGFGYDLILVDDVELPAYIRQGWSMAIDTSLVPNLKYHGQRWSDLVPEARGFAMPYGWGNYGIVYRSDLVKTPPSKWADLFDPNTEYAGKLQLPPQASELLVLSLLALDLDPNSNSPDDLKRAETLVKQQKDNVHTYDYPEYSRDNLLGQGAVTVAITYNSDAQILLEEDERLSFVSPKDKNIFWIDFFTISGRTQHKALALDFLNYLLDPAIVARNIEYHYTATFSDEATAMLPKEISEDPTVFPNIEGAITTIKPPKRNAIRTMMRLINTLGID